MERMVEGDYVEHWENGVGRVIAIDETSMIVDFLKRGKILFEKEKTVHFNRLNPSGLLVQLYETLEHIQDLVNQESTEIIKLLINDEDGGGKRYIERSRIKSLLTKAKPTDRGWRRDFGLVEENNWKRWWTNVSKKLGKDPQFDTSSKSVISLRDKVVSEVQNVYERFLVEAELDKKLSICEQLIKLLDKNTDSTILKDITEFTTHFIKENANKSFVHQVIYNLIQLKLKGVDVEPFNDKAYNLTLATLLSGKLPSAKAVSVFSFFKKLPAQNLFDHLILFLRADTKLRDAIVNNFKRHKGTAKAIREGRAENEPILSKQQILAINSLRVIGKDSFESGLVDLMKLKENKLVTDFLNRILLSEHADSSTKHAVSHVIVGFKVRNCIYDYLAIVQTSKDAEVPFLREFLNALGSEDAELCIKGMLFTGKASRERPNVFLAVFNNLVNDSISCIGPAQKNRLIDSVSNQLSQSLFDENIDLKLKLSQILTNIGTSKRLGDFDDTELIRLAESRQIDLSRRHEAIKLLIKKGFSNDCQGIGRHLISGINAKEFILLESIFSAFPDNVRVNEFFTSIIEEVNLLDDSLRRAFITFLQNANLTQQFLEFIFLQKDSGHHVNHFEKIKHLLDDDQLAKETMKLGFQMMLSDSEQSGNVVNRLISFYPPLVKWVLEETRDFCIAWKASLKDETERIKSDYEEEIGEVLNKHEIELKDAIDKTSQRYEEYLRRLIPALEGLKSFANEVKASIGKEGPASVQEKAMDKLVGISEDIEGVLKILKVIDRD